MSVHVDIVMNDWRRLTQQRVAIVYEFGGTVKVDVLYEGWENAIPNFVISDGRTVSIDGDPAAFFAGLPAAMDTRDLLATAPHDDDECAFTAGDLIEMDVEPYDNEANRRALAERRQLA